MIGRFTGTSSRACSPFSAFFSTPTLALANDGMYLATGSSSPSLPWSISIIAATDVIGLVIEKRRKMVSSRHRRVGHDIADAEQPVIDRLAVLLDQQHRTQDFFACNLVAEIRVDPLEFLRVEARAGGNIEGALRSRQWRCRRHQQRCADQRRATQRVNSSSPPRNYWQECNGRLNRHKGCRIQPTPAACSRALSFEKQQKMTRLTVGAAASAAAVAETAMRAARSAGKR